MNRNNKIALKISYTLPDRIGILDYIENHFSNFFDFNAIETTSKIIKFKDIYQELNKDYFNITIKCIKNNNNYMLLTQDKNKDIFVLTFYFDNIEKLKEENVKHLFHFNSFTCAYLYNVNYNIWQNTKQISNFEHFNLPHNHLSKIPDKIYGEIIDITKNVGYAVEVQKMWLMVGAEMWLGKEALTYFDKEKLMSFPYAEEIKEISNDLIYIKLYDVLEDPENDSNTKKQTEFRKWINMNEIIEKLTPVSKKKMTNNELLKFVLNFDKNKK